MLLNAVPFLISHIFMSVYDVLCKKQDAMDTSENISPYSNKS